MTKCSGPRFSRLNVKENTMSYIDEIRKLGEKVLIQALKIEEQKLTIKTLVSLIDELRQPYNNSVRHHYLYEKATDKLNKLEDREMI